MLARSPADIYTEMELLTARQILEALADGVDPRTGQVLDSGSPIESAQVVRALHLAIAAIDREARKQERSSSLPINAGKAWAVEQDQALARLFDSGGTVTAIAKELHRTRGSIASRLVRLGKVPDRQSAFVANLQLNQDGDGAQAAV